MTVLCQDFGDVWYVGTWVTVRASCGRGLRAGWWGRVGGERRRRCRGAARRTGSGTHRGDQRR